jgi:parallel beta-helix repeat protein
MHPRRTTSSSIRRRPFLTVIAGVLSLVTAAAVVGLGFPAGASDAVGVGLVASDTLARTVDSGLGSAETGGAYSVSGATGSVSGGQATLAGIKPGTAGSAVLTHVNAQQVSAQVTFVVPSLPTSNLYVALVLRGQDNGDAYRARARILANGSVKVGLSRARNGSETLIGGEATVALTAVAGQPITLQAQAIGTSTVALDARVWAAGTATPSSWQQSVSDDGSARITSAGAVGVWSYLSRSARTSTSVAMTRFGAYSDTGVTPAATTVTPVTAPTTAATQAPVVSTSVTPAPATTTVAVPVVPAPVVVAPEPAAQPVVTPVTGSVGSASPGGTNYPVPANALFVSPNGQDNAPGTINSPFRTVAHAVAVAPSGSTIELRAGLYHETVNVAQNRTLTIQAYPGEGVWFDGSSAVTSWHAVGKQWVHEGWTAQFDSTAGYEPGNAPTGEYWTFVSPSYPMASHADQLFLDGNALKQVTSPAAVTPGTFYVDYGSHQLVMGDNPAGHAVRASDLAVALSVYSPNSIVRGIGIRYYGTPVSEFGSLRMNGAGDILENVVVTDSASTGITIGGTKNIVRGVTVQRSGMLGLHADQADGLQLNNVLAILNNTEHFNQSPVSGGIKITRTRGVAVQNSIARDNLGPGIWLDEACYQMTITGNQMINNTGHGLSVEISSTAIIANNVITGSGQDGMKLNDADKLQVWNNT